MYGPFTFFEKEYLLFVVELILRALEFQQLNRDAGNWVFDIILDQQFTFFFFLLILLFLFSFFFLIVLILFFCLTNLLIVFRKLDFSVNSISNDVKYDATFVNKFCNDKTVELFSRSKSSLIKFEENHELENLKMSSKTKGSEIVGVFEIQLTIWF